MQTDNLICCSGFTLEDIRGRFPDFTEEQILEFIEDYDIDICERMIDAGWDYMAKNLEDYRK